jgi:hypothetical protein
MPPALPPLRLAVVGVLLDALIGGRFAAPQLSSTAIDSYGCGDSFAVGATQP